MLQRPGKAGFCITPADAANFGTSWAVSSEVWGALRLLIGCYLLALNIYSVWDSYDSRGARAIAYYWTSLTHWGLSFEVLYFLLAAILSLRWDKAAAEQTGLGAFAKLVWFAQDAIYAGSFVVFMLYWCLVYEGEYQGPISYQSHGVNFGLCLIDCFFTAAPVRLLHVWVPFLFGALYLLWSWIFYAAGLTIRRGNTDTRYIYKVLQWDSSHLTETLIVSALCLFVAMPAMHAGMCAWNSFGQWCSQRACSAARKASSKEKHLQLQQQQQQQQQEQQWFAPHSQLLASSSSVQPSAPPV